MEEGKSRKVSRATQQAVAIEQEQQREEEIKLTPEEEKLLRTLKYKIKDLREFAELARLVHWFHQNYEIGELLDVKGTEISKILHCRDESFLIANKFVTTALAFNVELKRENVAVRFGLSNIKPLSKYLNDLVINIHFPFEAVRQLLRNYVSEEDAKKLAMQIRELLKLPCSVSISDSNLVTMLIGPRVWEE